VAILLVAGLFWREDDPARPLAAPAPPVSLHFLGPVPVMNPAGEDRADASLPSRSD
jgi:hypothetical protein